MKKILSFILGAVLAIVVLVVLTIAVIKLPIKGLEEDLVILLLCISAIIVLFKVITFRYVRLGIFVAGILLNSLLAYIVVADFINEQRSRDVVVHKPKVTEYDRREKVFSDKTKSLTERFDRLAIGKSTDTIEVIFACEEYGFSNGSAYEQHSITYDFEGFELIGEEDSVERPGFFRSGDSLLLTFDIEQKIVKLKPADSSDSIFFAGYLPGSHVYIIGKSVSEYGIDYTSINAVNGQELDGIPLFRNPSNTYASFVQLKHFIGYLDVLIFFWEYDKRTGSYREIYEEAIPTSYFVKRKEYTPVVVSQQKWINDSEFTFVLTDKGAGMEKRESILVKSVITKRKSDF